MKRFIFWIFLFQVVARIGVCLGQEKIAISELLDFKTRTKALQDFVVTTDYTAKIFEWQDPAKFAQDHQDIGVLVSADRREKKQRYVVTWKRRSTFGADPVRPGDKFSTADFDRLFQPLGRSGLLFPEAIAYSVFEEDGSLVKVEGAPNSEIKGFVMDLNGDGATQVLEAVEVDSVKYVTVHPLTWPQPILAVAYEWADMKDHGVEWGYAIRNAENGPYDILFGPKDRDTITPEVVFRYNARIGTWTCENAGDHLHVLGLKNVWNEVLKLGKTGLRSN